MPVRTGTALICVLALLPPGAAAAPALDRVGRFESHTRSNPAISPDGRKIAFLRYNSGFRGIGSTNSVEVLDRAAGAVQDVGLTSQSPQLPVWLPDSSAVVFSAYFSGKLVVAPVDGAASREVAMGFAQSPQAVSRTGWIAFVHTDYTGTATIWTLAVVRPDGSGLRELVRHTGDGGPDAPAFSPDGTSIAFQLDNRLALIGFDGSGLRYLTGPVASADQSPGPPAWAPDGRSLAAAGHDGVLRLFDLAGGAPRVLATGAGAQDIAWSPTGDAVLYPTKRRWALAHRDGSPAQQLATLPFTYGFGASWTPDGEIVYAGYTAACGSGIYVQGTTPGARPRLLTRDCHVYGTPRADRLVGSNDPDIVYGLAGDDRLDGRAGNDILDGGPGNDRIVSGSLGDTIRGGPGNDVIVAGSGNDLLLGGPGNDRIAGNVGNDVIRGGPGRDILLGGQDYDTIDARDGERDIVDCGPGDEDVAIVDRLDVVRRCETVRRR